MPSLVLPNQVQKWSDTQHFISFSPFYKHTCCKNFLSFVIYVYRQVPNTYKVHFSKQLNCWLLRCSWSITSLHCSNYAVFLHLTPGFNILHKENCKPRWEAFELCDSVHLILEILQCIQHIYLSANKITIVVNDVSAHKATHFNSLAPGRSWCNYENAIFNLVLQFSIFRSSHDNALCCMQ